MTKNELRTEMRRLRRLVPDKAEKDAAVCRKIMQMPEYHSAATLFAYAALDEELCVDALIEAALNEGKTVALPYCLDRDGAMAFYTIHSLSELRENHFHVREPVAEQCAPCIDFEHSVLLVPGICFDKRGYRLGYGKGYYDRFLKKYPFISIGLCYNSLIKKEIPIEEYDRGVQLLVTEDNIFKTNTGGENG